MSTDANSMDANAGKRAEIEALRLELEREQLELDREQTRILMQGIGGSKMQIAAHGATIIGAVVALIALSAILLQLFG